MMIDRVTCIHNLYSDVVNVTKNLETNTYKAFDKDNKEITLDMNAVEAEFAKLDYQTKRMKEYPSLRNLADAMYWNSKGDTSKLTAYYEACEKVKTDPSPLNCVAVTIPVTSIPCEFAVTAEPTTIEDIVCGAVVAVTTPVTVKPCGKLGAPLAFSLVI